MKKKFSLTILPHRVWECLHSCLNLLCGLVFDYLQTWWNGGGFKVCNLLSIFRFAVFLDLLCSLIEKLRKLLNMIVAGKVGKGIALLLFCTFAMCIGIG
ncbi:hypothetical protein RchiOBHm_Chr7g0219641 [Rosa chinensis]|uniref:Uncharacterized protein n=1 Tax=Rosa chinensis TaxID=74649 RepID=A0A2P6PCK7_ROSCH|nr:hypothetical protein RchiOBHm_Chr7g0219641 [Rosa chinensis]